MSEPIEPTPVLEDAVLEDATDDDDDEILDMKAVRKLRSENRNLQSRLHEVQSGYERIVTQHGALLRRGVEQEAEKYLYDANDIWRADPDTQKEFYDEQFGDIIGDRVAEAARAIAASKPHLARPPQGPPPTDRPLEGLRGGASPEDKPPAPSWYTALRGG
jgi:hypothetical protein